MKHNIYQHECLHKLTYEYKQIHIISEIEHKHTQNIKI